MTPRLHSRTAWMLALLGVFDLGALEPPIYGTEPQRQPEPTARTVLQVTFDAPDQQESAKLGRSTGRVEIEDGAGHPGRAIHLTESAGFTFEPPIKTRPGSTYHVSWDCRTKDVSGMALAILVRGGKRDPVDGIAQGGTTTWSRHELVFAGDGQPATLSLLLREGGSAWFDNLVVLESGTYPKRVLFHPDNCFIIKSDPTATIWVNYPVDKIFPDDPVPERAEQKSEIELDVAGNECEAFQLVITPAEKPLAVELAVSDLRGPQPFSARQWTCHRVAYVDVPAEFIGVPYGRPGLNPDPLPRANALKAARAENAVFWITVSVPPGCKPGVYQGVLTLHGDVACEVPLRLRVRGFSLPEKPTICSQAIYRDVPSTLDSRPSEVVHNDWLDNARAHRMENGVWSFATDRGWARMGDGQLDLDFAAFDRALEFAFDHGAQYFHVPNISLRAGRGREVKVARWMGLEPFSPEFEQHFVEYCRRVGDHLRQKNLLQKAVFYPWDEPAPHEYETFKRICTLIKKGCPDAPIFVAGPNLPAPEFYSLVSGWTLNFRKPVADVLLERAAERARQGEVIGAYGNDRYRIDYPMAWHRLWGWTLKKYNMVMTGWFAVTMWGDDPWKNGLPVHSRMVASMPGAAFLLYPPGGGDDRLVISVRWEAITDGLEDYEYLTLLERLGNTREKGAGTRRVQEIIAQVVGGPSAFQCGTEMRRVQELRRLVADEIERLASFLSGKAK